MLIKPYSPAFLVCAPLLLVNTKPSNIQSRGCKCSIPAEITCIHLRFGATFLRFIVEKSQATKISEFNIEVLKDRFSKFLDMQNSEIDVTLSYSRVITVNIVGEVYYPGSYVLPAINTAFNALIAAVLGVVNFASGFANLTFSLIEEYPAAIVPDVHP